ncbi:MAG: Gfo/Idh/MocA family oxidoreductase [Clostridia bacterium]|nr:Gfo/Idh/MocA family oxidoreductase [Clostridia bacterium]
MKKTKWCIIGAGGIADRRTIPAILQDKNNEIVALMDKVKPVAEKLGEKYGVKAYTNEEKMLKENECDAVYVSTPVMCHYDQAMLVLKYGRNLFIEKPVGFDSKQGEKIVNAFKKAGKQISIGYMMKYHNLHVKARDMIKQDKIGQVASIRLQFSCWYPEIKGAWRQVKKLGGGGALMDLGVHCIELAEYVLDEEIEQVKGIINTTSFKYEVEDSAIITFKTKSGVLGHIDVNFNIPDNASISKLEIYGTKGYIICNGTLAQEEVGSMSYLYAPQGDYEAMQKRVVYKPKVYLGAKQNIYTKQMKAFADIIRSGKPDYFYADRAVQVQKVVDKVYKENEPKKSK